jgi:prophage regulatory protein
LMWKDLKQRVTLSRSTIQRLARQGQFPQPIRLSPARVAWRESDIAAWIAKRATNTGSYVAD